MIFGSKIYRAQTIENSISWALQELPTAPDGSIFLADTLIEAQGRQQRHWIIMPGQLLVTAIIKPQNFHHIPQEEQGLRLNQLSMAISSAIVRPLKEVKASLKWPNDIYLEGKKLGGILMKPVWQDNMLKGIIIGFGLNINTIFSPDHTLFDKATSLKMVTGCEHSIRELYFKILQTMDEGYVAWLSGDYQSIYKEWRNSQGYCGQEIIINPINGHAYTARLSQVLPNGDAIVTQSNLLQQQISFHLIEEILLARPAAPTPSH